MAGTRSHRAKQTRGERTGRPGRVGLGVTPDTLGTVGAPFDTDTLLWRFHRFGLDRAGASAVEAGVRRWISWGGFLTLLVWTSPLAPGQRVRAVGRLWAWQLWRRTARRPIEVVLPQGWRLRFPTWSVLAGITAATGLHEPAEQLFVFAYLRPGDDVVDVGANLGMYTVACAALGARVVAFEPSTTARQALEHNVAINDLGERVRVLAGALGERTGTVALTTGLDAANHLIDSGEPGGNQELVPVGPLDAALEQDVSGFDALNVMLLKIDAEGHDAAVLRGARATLERHRPVVLVETWAGGTEIRAHLAALHYRVYRFDLGRRRLVEYPPSWAGQANFIAVPDERFELVERRLLEKVPAPLEPPRVDWWVESR